MTAEDATRRLWPPDKPRLPATSPAALEARRQDAQLGLFVARRLAAVAGIPANPYRPIQPKPRPIRGVARMPNRYELELLERMLDPASDIASYLPVLVDRVRAYQPATIVELGTRAGNSTTAFLYGLEALHGGRLVTVDLDVAPALPRPSERVSWTHLRGDDLEELVLDAVPGRIDLLFIDTSHEYARTLDELRTYGRRVPEGGLIVLHDTQMEQPDGYPDGVAWPVRTAAQRWIAAQPRTIHYLEHEWSYGLAILEVGAELDPNRRGVGR